jgi:UDP-2-acetamido-2-deoxy-ribo-hexuluronate aminotransferase
VSIKPGQAQCGYKWGDFPNAERASREVLSLPMHPYLSATEQASVIQTLREALPLASSATVEQKPAAL